MRILLIITIFLSLFLVQCTPDYFAVFPVNGGSSSGPSGNTNPDNPVTSTCTIRVLLLALFQGITPNLNTDFSSTTRNSSLELISSNCPGNFLNTQLEGFVTTVENTVAGQSLSISFKDLELDTTVTDSSESQLDFEYNSGPFSLSGLPGCLISIQISDGIMEQNDRLFPTGTIHTFLAMEAAKVEELVPEEFGRRDLSATLDIDFESVDLGICSRFWDI